MADPQGLNDNSVNLHTLCNQHPDIVADSHLNKKWNYGMGYYVCDGSHIDHVVVLWALINAMGTAYSNNLHDTLLSILLDAPVGDPYGI